MAMEAAGAGLAMQSRAVGVVGGGSRSRSRALGGDKRARAGSLRIGGPAGGAALRARGAKPVAPLCCVKTSRGQQSLHNSVDEALLLKRKAEQVLFELNGR